MARLTDFHRQQAPTWMSGGGGWWWCCLRAAADEVRLVRVGRKVQSINIA
jgi:hypothetical protein